MIETKSKKMKKGSGTQKLNCYTREIFKKPILLESLGL